MIDEQAKDEKEREIADKLRQMANPNRSPRGAV
jgi:hypothetical protein